MHNTQNVYTYWWNLFTEFANAKQKIPFYTTLSAVHSVISAFTHCRTKLQLLQSFHFGCDRNMTYKCQLNILLKHFLPGKNEVVTSI
jgi:hypothetical protein